MSSPVPPSPEPAHDILRRVQRPLDVFFAPRTVAVIGATETPASVGRMVLQNLITHPFGGTVFPVNLHRRQVLGLTAYPTIDKVPSPVDLAVVVTPALSVPGLIAECAATGVKGVIIISAGFREAGTKGAELEQQVLAQARRGGIRVIGPNCLGVMCPRTGLNATFAGMMARPGRVAFISQSGALCTAILDWSLRELVGFSAFVSVGSMLDVGWGALIDYLGDDPHTHSILLYMESIGDVRAFLSAAREVALTKPIIVLKAGRTRAAAGAAASHTGALVGSDEVLDAAFRRCGVLRVDRLVDLFAMAEVLAKQPLPKGPRLTIVTNAGGPGVLATDALIASGGVLGTLSKETIEVLNQVLPSPWSHGNPIDVLGDADPDRYTKAIEIATQDTESDGLLAILTPQAMTDPTRTAEELARVASHGEKPVLASWMGGNSMAAGEALLNQAGIPTFPYPDVAARTFVDMWRHSDQLRLLYETPIRLTTDEDEPGHRQERREVERILQRIRTRGRTLLSEVESKQVLAAYDISTVEPRVATSEEQAVTLAADMGYPVVLKLHSETISHKTEVGGIRLNLRGAPSVRRAYRAIRSAVEKAAVPGAFLGVTVQPMITREGYELIIGSSPDPEFGPVLLFGAGGQLVEVLKDQAFGLPPLTTTLAFRIMERTRIFQALHGIRGRPPVDMNALAALLVRFSHLVIEQPRIREIEINPLLTSPEGFLALDARVVLYGVEVADGSLPRPAIRPYPTQYAAPWTMKKDGTVVMIRPIRPEDEPMMVDFHRALSEQSVYQRYFQLLKLSQRITHERLTRLCFVDYDREMVLVADRSEGGPSGTHEILAVARLIRIEQPDVAEFAILVHDRYQGAGLGTEMLRRLIRIGRQEGFKHIRGDILMENLVMQRVCRKLGFRLDQATGDPLVRATLAL